MSNGISNINDYFPAGSTATDSIKTRINNGIQNGTLQINGPVLTLEDLKTIRAEDKKRFHITLAVTIIFAIIGIISGLIFI